MRERARLRNSDQVTVQGERSLFRNVCELKEDYTVTKMDVLIGKITFPFLH
jgi:hypothetical protein